jgi:hypothetical protein
MPVIVAGVFSANDGAAQQDRPEEFRALLADGREVVGDPLELSAETLVLGGAQRLEAAAAEIVRMHAADRRASPPPAHSSVVLLVNGDRLLIDRSSLRISDVELTGAWDSYPAWAPLKVPLETVRGVVLDWPDSRDAGDRLAAIVEEHAGNSDVFVLANGDRLAAEFRGMDETQVQLGGAVAAVPRSNVRAVAFNPELFSLPSPEGVHMLISLVDGTRIMAAGTRLEPGGELRIAAVWGQSLEVPLSRVSAIRVLGGRAEWLGRRDPDDYRFEPYLSSQWKLRRNRNATGGPLRLDDAECPFGLGMHSRASATYDLGGKYRWFRAAIGVDETAGERGSVVFGVEVDGERVYTSPVLKASDAAVSLEPIDLTGKQRLTLVVDYGPWGDVQDYANWCDAVLVRCAR